MGLSIPPQIQPVLLRTLFLILMDAPQLLVLILYVQKYVTNDVTTSQASFLLVFLCTALTLKVQLQTLAQAALATSEPEETRIDVGLVDGKTVIAIMLSVPMHEPGTPPEIHAPVTTYPEGHDTLGVEQESVMTVLTIITSAIAFCTHNPSPNTPQ
jgi:hypothetical protein